MADLVMNLVKGKVRQYTALPGTNDALIVVPLEATGLEADATLKDYDTLAALLAGSTNEQTTLGRKTVTASITENVDDTNDRVDVDMPDIVWAATAGNPVGAVLICYDPDTTGGTDADIVPLVKLDTPFTPDGTEVTISLNAAGFYRAA
ncbi:hypothetical protein [Actinomadura rubrisoli]|uniref:Phage tail protein n=1 Tax=Actinomadura rubrisoli TaxID=2530368 RepID=A0A4R5CDL9_9ACTN|nr:hypothetical protein [Actinomadura rubrisoli]TDD97615.1 hypothetical protein E1298_00870 [Actinomadura rubrisoli]